MHLPSTYPLAQTAETALTKTSYQLDWPENAGDWSLFAAFGAAAVYVVWMYVRDTRTMSVGWTVWLTCLRLAFLAGLAIVALNPQERTQKDAYRQSQTVLLVDTSTSMQQPERDPRLSGSAPVRTRADAVRALLADSPLIDALRKTHQVDLYTFDGELSASLHRFPSRYSPTEGGAVPPLAEGTPAESPPNWEALLQPRGNATRLGDSLDKLLAEVQGKTLGGVVVLTDGASNVGRDVRTANERAKANGIRLFAVGVGGTEPPVNLQVAKLSAPTDVQLPRGDDARDGQDTFEVSAFLQAEGLGGRTVQVELLRKFADEESPTVVATQEVTLPEGADPATATFQQVPERTGGVEYSVRAAAPTGVIESRADDNVLTRTVNVFDQPLRVLLVAGGPMRDYTFVRNALHRHKSMQVDIWLQTGSVGISQESNEILFEFPKEREDLFQYDVIVAFDPDWSQIPDASQEMLEDWVSSEGGGLILVAGDVYTPQLAAALEQPQGGMQHIASLYPVLLEQVKYSLGSSDRADQPWKWGLTQEGKAAGFLKLLDEPSATMDVWEEFPGVYRCYPTRGRKGGTTVYAEFTNPLSRGADGQPVLLAGQRYSQGNTLYLGSPEVWRLRSIDEDYYDRFWIKLVRKAAEGRTKRGLQRGMLILEGRDYDVGQTVPVRARVQSAQFQPLTEDTVAIEVYDPTGRPMVPAPVLKRDPNRREEYVGDFLALLPGRYRVELAVPDSREQVAADINVTLPALEMAELRQDAQALKKLVEGTGGAYLSADEAAERLPDLVPNMGQQIVIDQQLRELWDRQWVLFLMVGLLGVEWLTRKLLKLA